MTYAEAIRILNPETSRETIAEIEYYGGFSGKEVAIKAIEDACLLACESMKVDAAKTIRCKNCDHSTVINRKRYCGGRFSFAAYSVVADDDFCSRAERKQND